MLTNAQLSEISRDAQIAYALGKVRSFELAFARGVEAAATAEARALVGQMLEAHHQCAHAQLAFLLAVKSGDAAAGQLERAYIAAASELERAAGNLGAWLGEAQKGDGHGNV